MNNYDYKVLILFRLNFNRAHGTRSTCSSTPAHRSPRENEEAGKKKPSTNAHTNVADCKHITNRPGSEREETTFHIFAVNANSLEFPF